MSSFEANLARACTMGLTGRSVHDDYDFDEEKIGEGTFGVVFRGRLRCEPRIKVAAKLVKLRGAGSDGLLVTAVRELALLRELNHENIVALQDVRISLRRRNVYLVFEYADFDLYEYVRHLRESGQPTPMYTVKSIVHQLLKGVRYLHHNWILHRDLKPSNLLLMADSGTVKIADFGLARLFHDPQRPLSRDGVVVTVWYRAPELLLGARHYTCAVDMWSVGCIMAELIMQRPLFPGRESEKIREFQVHQFKHLVAWLGMPQVSSWPSLPYLPFYDQASSLPDSPRRLHDHPHLSSFAAQCPVGFDLLKRMLTYDPSARITADDALAHAFFSEEPLPGSNCLRPPGASVDVTTVPARSGSPESSPAPAAGRAAPHVSSSGDATHRPQPLDQSSASAAPARLAPHVPRAEVADAPEARPAAPVPEMPRAPSVRELRALPKSLSREQFSMLARPPTRPIVPSSSIPAPAPPPQLSQVPTRAAPRSHVTPAATAGAATRGLDAQRRYELQLQAVRAKLRSHGVPEDKLEHTARMFMLRLARNSAAAAAAARPGGNVLSSARQQAQAGGGHRHRAAHAAHPAAAASAPSTDTGSGAGAGTGTVGISVEELEAKKAKLLALQRQLQQQLVRLSGTEASSTSTAATGTAGNDVDASQAGVRRQLPSGSQASASTAAKRSRHAPAASPWTPWTPR